MKNVANFWIGVCLLWLPISGLQGQDLIVRTVGDSIDCKIVSITEDRIHFWFYKENQKVSTFLSKEQVASYLPGYYQRHVIIKNDGSEYIGRLLSDDAREVLIDTEKLGRIYIPKSDIRSIVKLDSDDKVVGGQYYSTGSFTTRYAFTTNALPIQRGENYALLNLHGPEVHFAVSDHLNVGLMSTWFGSPFIFAAKYTIATKDEKVNFSIGTLLGTSGYINSFRGFGGLHFANVTFGDRDQNFTLGAGYAYLKTGNEDYGSREPGVYLSDNAWDTYNYSNSGWYSEPNYLIQPLIHGPVFSMAGIRKVGSKASFVFDSMIGTFHSTDNRIVRTTTLRETVYDPEYIPGSYSHTVAGVKTTAVALFLMPGIRIQTKENRAFQVSLAGVSVIEGKGYQYRDTYSLPMPMCTWFYNF